MEQEKTLEERIKELMQERREELINDKICQEQFNDEQRGMLREWLVQFYGLGYEDGQKSAIAKQMPDEVMESFQRIIGLADKENGEPGEDDTRKLRIKAELYEHLYHQMCSVASIHEFSNRIFERAFKGEELFPHNAYTCLGTTAR